MQKLELYLNNEKADLSDSTSISLTFQVNDLADLKDRQSTFSNSFKLPLTKNNKRIIGNAQSNAFANNNPYRYYETKLVENGLEQIVKGKSTLQKSTDFFELNTVAGVFGINDLLKKNVYNRITGLLESIDDAKLIDLDYADIPNFNFDLATIAASQTSGKTLWPVIDYGGTLKAGSTVDISYLRPGIFLKDILDKIQKYTGYKFYGGSAYQDGFNDFIPFSATSLLDYQGTSWFDTHIQLSVVKNLPDFTLKDILKDYMQRYFLTPVVDNLKRTVSFHSLDELYQNKINAKDWTNKFIKDTVETDFTFGNYAQSNSFLWTDDQQYFYDANGFILVDNTTLNLTTNIVKSIFAGTDAAFNVFGGQRVAKIIKYSAPPGGLAAITEIDTKPRVVRIVNANGQFAFKDDNSTVFTNAKIGTPVDWQDQITNYATGLKKLLKKCRIETRSAYLTPFDVYNFDFFTPVYDTREAAYYYVNKISNYQSGKICKVQMIKM